MFKNNGCSRPSRVIGHLTVKQCKGAWPFLKLLVATIVNVNVLGFSATENLLESNYDSVSPFWFWKLAGVVEGGLAELGNGNGGSFWVSGRVLRTRKHTEAYFEAKTYCFFSGVAEIRWHFFGQSLKLILK